jgi:hypothetical protein
LVAQIEQAELVVGGSRSGAGAIRPAPGAFTQVGLDSFEALDLLGDNRVGFGIGICGYF